MEKGKNMGLLNQYDESKTKSIRLLEVNDYGSNVWVTFAVTYKDGGKKVVRSHVRDLGGCRQLNGSMKPIRKAECLGTAYCGILKTDGRTLFVVTLEDDTVQLIQVREGSAECRRLLELEHF